MRLLEREK
ncbi:hypothetical protein LINPERPRIM_LOCUS25176 [Linum perenne]